MKSVIIKDRCNKGGFFKMKKLVYSSALIALLLAGCGSTEEEASTPAKTATEETTTEATQSKDNEAETTVEIQDETEATESAEEEVSTEETTTTSPATSTEAVPTEQATETVEEGLTLYATNEDSTQIVPFQVAYEGDENQLVPFIFEKVDLYETNLLDYEFQNYGKTLVLNIDDSIFNVQGSTGGTMYTNTLVQSFFDNFEQLQEVTFLYNNSTEPVVDHVNIGTPYTRADITNIAQ